MQSEQEEGMCLFFLFCYSLLTSFHSSVFIINMSIPFSIQRKIDDWDNRIILMASSRRIIVNLLANFSYFRHYRAYWRIVEPKD